MGTPPYLGDQIIIAAMARAARWRIWMAQIEPPVDVKEAAD